MGVKWKHKGKKRKKIKCLTAQKYLNLYLKLVIMDFKSIDTYILAYTFEIRMWQLKNNILQFTIGQKIISSVTI